MSMRSLEDLERAFDRGLNAWESEIVASHAEKMGKKVVREVKRETKVVTGNLRRRWDSRVEKEDGGVNIIAENLQMSLMPQGRIHLEICAVKGQGKCLYFGKIYRCRHLHVSRQRQTFGQIVFRDREERHTVLVDILVKVEVLTRSENRISHNGNLIRLNHWGLRSGLDRGVGRSVFTGCEPQRHRTHNQYLIFFHLF